MRYQLPKFTLPASENTTNERWDFAFLTKSEFILKHGLKKYNELKDDRSF